ncbi:uncharacterized protein [Dermacentor albipictus]|uniref:uncharacterized protein isoform X1 n=1 Tax=Dermacentor albipictus TaxID=60249 RepID=UPI0031FBDFB3
MAPGKLLGRLLIVAIVSLFDAIEDADADEGIQWLGDACNNDDDCHDAFNLLCVKGQCTCKHGFVSAQFSCHPASPLGGKCTYHAQCQYSDPHSACDLTGHCVCVEGFSMRQDTKKCAAAEADDDRQYPDVLRPHAITGHRSSYGSGVTTFGIIVLVLAFVLAIACLLKFVICNWNQQAPPRKHSRKYNYLTVGYLKDNETQALLPPGRRPPSYSEATRVPQITISDYSSLSHPTTTVYTST